MNIFLLLFWVLAFFVCLYFVLNCSSCNFSIVKHVNNLHFPLTYSTHSAYCLQTSNSICPASLNVNLCSNKCAEMDPFHIDQNKACIFHKKTNGLLK